LRDLVLKELWPLDRSVFPTPVALITSISLQGKPNIITLAEVFMLCIRNPLTIGLAINPTRYSNKLIRETKEFVLNIPTVDIIDLVDYCGIVSGRRYDKFKVTGLTPKQALHVSPPLIEECPVNIECELSKVIPLGYHDFFMGKALAVHVDEKIIEENRIDIKKAKPIVYNLGEYWTCGKLIAKHGFMKDKQI
jgi:flavin reductase (DIM6/NTAB) family NADH-FMN oxidoreductase RutF